MFLLHTLDPLHMRHDHACVLCSNDDYTTTSSRELQGWVSVCDVMQRLGILRERVHIMGSHVAFLLQTCVSPNAVIK
jgi:hypothetical protein